MSKSTRGSWIDVNDDFLKQVQQDQHDHKNPPSQTRERRESILAGSCATEHQQCQCAKSN